MLFCLLSIGYSQDWSELHIIDRGYQTYIISPSYASQSIGVLRDLLTIYNDKVVNSTITSNVNMLSEISPFILLKPIIYAGLAYIVVCVSQLVRDPSHVDSDVCQEEEIMQENKPSYIVIKNQIEVIPQSLVVPPLILSLETSWDGIVNKGMPKYQNVSAKKPNIGQIYYKNKCFRNSRECELDCYPSRSIFGEDNWY